MKKKYIKSAVKSFALHIHPKKIDSRALKFNRTFGLGGLSVLLLIILFFSGLILRFSYIPTINGAYNSILSLQNYSLFGAFIRNIHHLSANLLIITTFLHIVRVYYSQAIYGIRAKNWIYGMLLFLMVIIANFTGYLLPWNQLAYWAITVVTQIIENIPLIGHFTADLVRGGNNLNNNTLLRFYTIHTGVLPLLFIVLSAIHFWLVRKAGGIALPKSNTKKVIEVVPYLVKLEAMLAIITIAGVLLVSVFYNAPLQEQANPLNSPNPIKAPWYFLGAQELLLHLHPMFSTIIIPLLFTVFLFYLPFFKYKNINIGVWFNSTAGKKLIIISAIFSIVFTFVIIYSFEHFLDFQVILPNINPIISNGILPFLLYITPNTIFLLFIKYKYRIKQVELIMAITTILLSSYICMVVISLLLRGKGMVLVI